MVKLRGEYFGNIDFSEQTFIFLVFSAVNFSPAAVRTSDKAFYYTPTRDTASKDFGDIGAAEPKPNFSTVPLDAQQLQVILNRIKMVKEIQEAFMNGQSDVGF